MADLRPVFSTGVPGVDAALSLATAVWSQFKLLGATSAAAAATAPRIQQVAGLLADVCASGTADGLHSALAEMSDALMTAREAAAAALPLAAGASWAARLCHFVGRFVHAFSRGDALRAVNDRLDRAIVMMQAKVGLLSAEKLAAMGDMMARGESALRAMSEAAARSHIEEMAALIELKVDVKQLAAAQTRVLEQLAAHVDDLVGAAAGGGGACRCGCRCCGAPQSCIRGSQCSLEGCRDTHPVRDPARFSDQLTATGSLSWCARHSMWHASDRGFFCFSNGDWTENYINREKLHASQVPAVELRRVGYKNVDELKRGGYDALELKDCGFLCAELRSGGYSASELKAAGFDVRALKMAGFEEGYLEAAGFSDAELTAAGFAPRPPKRSFQERLDALRAR